MIPRLGSVPLSRLTGARLDQFYADLLTVGRRRNGVGGLAPRTVRYIHMILRRALKEAVESGALYRNPADLAHPPKPRGKQMRTWSADDLRAFLVSVSEDRLYACYLLASTTGMRRGELLGLRIEDLHLEEARLHVRLTLIATDRDDDHARGYDFSEPKTKRSRRSLSLDPATVSALRAHRARTLEERLASGAGYDENKDGLVFTRENGSPIHPTSLSRAFAARVKEAGVPEIRFHDLRHTYATFERAQKLLEVRAESLPSRAANASDYLLTGLLQCVRCGHGFIGTSAHGRGGVYRYYTCFSRQRHGTARCDQERIPADPLEEAIVAEALAALDDGSIFLEAASKADEARTAARSDEVAERGELSAEVASKREATDRYLKAFETGELPPSACAHRLEELHKGIEALEKRRAALEAELAETTTAFSKKDLVRLKHEIGAALLGAGPEQVKELLSVVVSEIRVECRSSIQPFFVAPGVRTPAPKRRRTGIEPAHRGRRWGCRAHRGAGESCFGPGGSAGAVCGGGGRESNPPTGDRPAHRF